MKFVVYQLNASSVKNKTRSCVIPIKNLTGNSLRPCTIVSVYDLCDSFQKAFIINSLLQTQTSLGLKSRLTPLFNHDFKS